MNLPVKQKIKGLASLPALFLLLFGCEEPSELGVNLNPKEGQISTHYIEIPVEATQLRIDTVISSSRVVFTPTSSGGASISFSPVLVGKTVDPVFGTINATTFSNVNIPWDTLPVVSETAGIDSVFLNLSVGPNIFGNNFSSDQEIKILRTEEAIPPTSSGSENPQYLYFTTAERPLSEEIGHLTFNSSDFSANGLKIPIEAGSSFATEILEQMKTNEDIFTNQADFNALIGGIALVPGEENTFINSYNLAGRSSISFYYGGLKKPVTFNFTPKSPQTIPVESNGDYLPSYTYIDTDYTGTIFENAPTENNSEFQNPDNQVYYSAGAGFFPKFNFSALEDFANSNSGKSMIINKATLEIDSMYNSTGTKTFPNQPNFLFIDDQNNKPVTGVSQVAGAQFNPVLPNRINSEEDTVYAYAADIAQDVEYFIKTKNDDYLQGMIYPSSFGSPVTLFNFIADPKRVKLKIYYTLLEN